MSVVFFTVAELCVLTVMLGGLLRKRAHAPRPVPARTRATPVR